MITLFLHLLRLLPLLCGGHRQLALENLALRHQLAVYRRSKPRPKLRTTDRVFWVGLARVWAGATSGARMRLKVRMTASPISRMGTWWRMAGGSLADECCPQESAALVDHALLVGSRTGAVPAWVRLQPPPH